MKLKLIPAFQFMNRDLKAADEVKSHFVSSAHFSYFFNNLSLSFLRETSLLNTSLQ